MAHIPLRKRVLIAAIVAVILFAVFFVVHGVLSARPIVYLDKQRIAVTIASTDADREKGLGGRTGLGDHEGMLFIFPQDSYESFWMKDMRFSIDMLWLSDDGTVVYIQPDVSPSTYPQTFQPNNPARYVIELPANFAKRYGIKVGDIAVLP